MKKTFALSMQKIMLQAKYAQESIEIFEEIQHEKTDSNNIKHAGRSLRRHVKQAYTHQRQWKNFKSQKK